MERPSLELNYFQNISNIGIALKCKTGNCKNSKEVSGCQTKFEDMDCKDDHVCYREQQQPYGIDEGSYFFSIEQH